ncbi:hypothetical protein KY343_04960 [Candidatus Woesearchaeota archaeon]|nr:hypothetical protein [Candidatus Woesearchaeota archaeon]
MSKKIYLKKQPTPINLVDWIGLYDTEVRVNYGLEFLTAATYGSISIPDSRRYQLPPDVQDKDLDKTIEDSVPLIRNRKKRRERIRSNKKSIIRGWEQGKKPWAIKCLDELREVENPEFRIDLLKPRLYDGTESTGNNLPFATDILPGLVYLYMSVLISGCSSKTNPHIQHTNPKGNAAIYPSRSLPKKLLKAKIRGIYTENRECEGVGLKQPYGNILQLLGMPQGRLSEKSYEELGLGFIEKLISWAEKERLSKKDHNHAIKTLNRFIEAFTDHRFGIYDCKDRRGYIQRVAQFYTSGFRKKKTQDKFTALFLRTWNIISPDIPLSIWPTKMHSPPTYHSVLKVKSDYHDRFKTAFNVS